jgi:mono/diheme cytochrome c family protein
MKQVANRADAAGHQRGLGLAGGTAGGRQAGDIAPAVVAARLRRRRSACGRRIEVTARRLIALLLGALFLAAAVVVALNVRDEGEGVDLPAADSVTTRTPADLIARGEYLARAGDCIGCHTARGGVPYAGGRGIETPFGTVYAPNLTPDPQTGLGRLVGERLLARAAQRTLARRPAAVSRVPVPELHPRRAGRLGCDVRLPAQPAAGGASQPAAHARLSVQPAGVARDLARALLQARCLHGRSGAAGRMEPGRLSVEGLGHCNACHSSRNALGAPVGPLDLAGD